MAAFNRLIPPFETPYAAPDEDFASHWLREQPDPAADGRIDAMATRLVKAIRAKTGGLGGIEDFLHAYSLSTREGLALMVLAEALLRVPDADTANRLIEDKLSAADWSHPDAGNLASGLRVGLDARRHGAADRARRDAGNDPARSGEAHWFTGDPHRGATGDAAARIAFRAGPDHRRSAEAVRRPGAMAFLLRHAGRGRAHAR